MFLPFLNGINEQIFIKFQRMYYISKIFDLENVTTPVRSDVFSQLLEESGYDKCKREFLIEGFQNGFNLQYTGRRDVKITSPNLKFTIGNEIELWNKVMKEVKEGRYAGPYDNPPFEHFIQSPIGLVPKDQGTKTRLIFHLSYPRGQCTSVNINTPDDICKVKYKDFDQAIRLIIKEGKGCNLAKSDLVSAFRQLGIRKQDWCLLVMKCKSPRDNKTYYFVDKCLPFGHSISCALFQQVSDAISHIVKYQTKHDNINYLDNFLFTQLMRVACNQQIRTFLNVCADIGFPVSDEKTVWATGRLTFLGLLIDTLRQLVCIPEDKIVKIEKLLCYFLSKHSKKVTLRNYNNCAVI